MSEIRRLFLATALFLASSFGVNAGDIQPFKDTQWCEPLAENILSLQRGKSILDNSVVTDNLIIYSGDIQIRQQNTINNAFNHSKGVFTIVQNSGNNVLINTTTTVNIMFK